MPDIGVNTNVLGVDTHNRRDERSRKRNHPQTNVINVAEKHEECLRILQSAINIKLTNEVFFRAAKRQKKEACQCHITI
jgi:hypothetical protein